MAKVLGMTEGGWHVVLDEDETQAIHKHAVSNTLSESDAVADVVEYAIASLGDVVTFAAMAGEETEVSVHESVRMVLLYPKSGPYASLTPKDKTFMESVLSMSLREGLCVVLYKKSQGSN